MSPRIFAFAGPRVLPPGGGDLILSALAQHTAPGTRWVVGCALQLETAYRTTPAPAKVTHALEFDGWEIPDAPCDINPLGIEYDHFSAWIDAQGEWESDCLEDLAAVEYERKYGESWEV
ncbi:hypothetical protein CCP4SC76_390028 [Gammaproteobacteria bacterium]